MIRERCSCGAEFETDEQQALRLVKDWRINHKHNIASEQHDSSIESTLGIAADVKEPELHIGFRPDPLEE